MTKLTPLLECPKVSCPVRNLVSNGVTQGYQSDHSYLPQSLMPRGQVTGLTYLAISGLNFYKKFLSPLLPIFLSSSFLGCRFYPSCSDYASEALRQYGLMKGFMLSLKRLLRCHPFSRGGYDPLPLP